MNTDTAQEQNNAQVVLEEDQLVCMLTNKVVKATEKELNLQSMIAMMMDEYGFSADDMERDFKVKFEDQGTGKQRSVKATLLSFRLGGSTLQRILSASSSLQRTLR